MGAHTGVGAAADLNSSMPFHSSSLYESNWMTQKHMMYSQHRYSQITHSIHSPVSNQASYPFSYQSALDQAQKSPEFYNTTSPESGMGGFRGQPGNERPPPACYLTPSPESSPPTQFTQQSSPCSATNQEPTHATPTQLSMPHVTFSPGLNPNDTRPKSQGPGPNQACFTQTELQF